MLDELFDRELTPSLVLDVLGDHVGAANGLSARELVHAVCGLSTAAGERRLRSVIEALRSAGHPIAALKRVAMPDLRGQLRLPISRAA